MMARIKRFFTDGPAGGVIIVLLFGFGFVFKCVEASDDSNLQEEAKRDYGESCDPGTSMRLWGRKLRWIDACGEIAVYKRAEWNQGRGMEWRRVAVIPLTDLDPIPPMSIDPEAKEMP